MKRLSTKLCGASLVALAFSLNMVTPVWAQTCTAAPSCETLGFTKSTSDCEGHSILKCPFDQTKLYCDSGASGGDGGTSNCDVGDILYSDKTCSVEPIDGKTPIAVVFDKQRRLAVALEEKSRAWSGDSFTPDSFDVSGLANKTSESVAKADFAGKSNTSKVLAYCQANGKSCPAFEYVSTYKTAGTNEGDWYLPALGELNKLYENKDSVNATLNQISGTSLCTTTYCPFYYWSSSEKDSMYAWHTLFCDGRVGYDAKYTMYHPVRPVLAF